MDDVPPELKVLPEYLSSTIVKDPVWSEARFSTESKMQQSIRAQETFSDPIERATAEMDEKRLAARNFASAGDYVKALKLFQRAVSGMVESLGKDHIALAPGLCDLSWCLIDQGRFVEAAEVADRAWKIYDRYHGPGHASTLTALARCLRTCRMLNRWDRVSALCKMAEAGMEAAELTAAKEEVEAEQARREAQHAERLLCEARNEGDAKLVQLRLQQFTAKEAVATKELEEAMEAKTHRDKATTALLDDLADAYRGLGRFAEAERIGIRDVALCRQVFGSEHHNTAHALRGVAETHKERGNFRLARSALNEALEVYRSSNGVTHPDTGAVIASLADITSKQGKLREAKKLFLGALDVMTDPPHPELAEVLKAHAENLLLLGEKKAAKRAFDSAINEATWS